MKTLSLVLVSSVIALLAVTAKKVRPLVETKLGKVEGLWRTSFDGRKYASYEGVPYAKPPVGELRFEESRPVESWPGVWNATQQYKCPQASIYSADDYLGSEDCLYLNIYVPEVSPPKKLDVVVHIHAGCFMWGYNQEFLGDKYFMDRDVILVSMNYRLNAFGFLSTEDEVVPGNNGLKDQRLALNWIHQNIHSFGGNQNSITITGFSAGAASVQYHYLSPGSKGLFNRGMSVSGSSLGPWAVQEQPMKMTRRLAKVVGCDFESSKDLVACLKTRPVRLLLESIVKHVYPMFPFPLCPYAPVLEKGGKNPFLTQDPYVLLKNGKVTDLPWINSYTTDDGLISSIAFVDRVDEIVNSWSDSFPYITETYNTMPAGKSEAIGKKIWDFYLSNAKNQKEQFDQLSKMSTDRLLRTPNEQSAEIQSRVTKSPVYFYLFDFYGNHSLRYDLHKNPPPGVYHGDDMVYMFGGLIKKPLSETEIKMKNVMMDFLQSYVTKGVPTLKGVPLESIEDKFVFYKISGPDDIQKKIKTDYSIDNFWSSLGLMESEDLLPSKDEL